MEKGKWSKVGVLLATLIVFLILVLALTQGNLRDSEDDLGDLFGQTTGTAR